MRHSTTALALLLLLALVGPAAADAEDHAHESHASYAELLFLVGDVQAHHADGEALALDVGARLTAGDVLRTGQDASASLRLVALEHSLDHEHLMVDANSEIAIGQILTDASGKQRNVLLKLLHGAVQLVTSRSAETRKEVEVETPTAIGGVRGTDFRVAVEDDADGVAAATRFETLQGTVAVSAEGAEVAVEAGMGSRVAAGEPPGAPQPLPAAPAVLVPADGGALTDARFAWEPVPGATAYVLEVARDDHFLHRDLWIAVDGPEYAPDRLGLPLHDGAFHWRVSAVDDQGFRGTPSATRTFTLPTP